MNAAPRPVTGYLLIKTSYIDDEIVTSTDPCDIKYKDSLESIGCKINRILKSSPGDVEGPFRGSIVKSTEEPELTIIVSFRARDETIFNKIAKSIIGLSAPANSEVKVSGVTAAISTSVPDGFVGPP